jgi:ParB family chromosome partitioning protein
MNKPVDSFPKLKGVAALLSNTQSQESEPIKPNSVAINCINVTLSQPRRYFDSEKLEKLAASFKQVGILEPLIVRPMPNGDGTYELLAGERRLRAATLAQMSEVPVTICDVDDKTAQSIRLIENLLREELNAFEETKGILDLIAHELEISPDKAVSLLYRLHDESKGKVPHNVMGSPQNLAIETVFDNIGTMSWESFIKNRLPLLKLPEDIKEVLSSGKIEYTKAKTIAKVKDEATRKSILEKTITENLSLVQIRQLVEDIIKSQKNSTTQEDDELSELRFRYKDVTKRINTSKIWQDSKKQQKLKRLLDQLEDLMK